MESITIILPVSNFTITPLIYGVLVVRVIMLRNGKIQRYPRLLVKRCQVTALRSARGCQNMEIAWNFSLKPLKLDAIIWLCIYFDPPVYAQTPSCNELRVITM